MDRHIPLFARLSLILLLAAARAVGQSPTDHDSRQKADEAFRLAVRLEQSGNFEQALGLYRQLFEDHPDNSRYYQRFRRLLSNQGLQTELLRVMEIHLKQFPDDLQSWVDMGDIYIGMQLPREALAVWRRTLERFPGNETAQRLVLTHMLTSNLSEEGRALLERVRRERNDPGFFALEMGRLHAARLNYDLAVEEYLRYLAIHPQAVRTVSNHLLQFPVEPELMVMLREKLVADGTPGALGALATVEFKHRNFERVVSLYEQLGVPPKEYFELGRDLIDEGEYLLSEQVMESLLAAPEAAAFHERALMALAGIYQARSQASQVDLPLSGFYPNNSFFAIPFVGVAEADLASLRRAMALYDSLNTRWDNPLARLRLGEIRYRLLDDFDGAITDFQAVLLHRNAARYQVQVLFLLVDAWLAKGDLEEAGRALQQARQRLRTEEQVSRAELKSVHLLFLSVDQDSLAAYLRGQFASVAPDDPFFNDLLELSGIVQRFAGYPQAYETFVRCERLLRQNRRSEAIALLDGAVQDPDSPVTPVLQYRLAHLLALQGEYTRAAELCRSIPGETEFSELGLLLAAEIADRFQQENELASTRYLAFLDTYPLSIYRDAVRLRYRQLNPKVQ